MRCAHPLLPLGLGGAAAGAASRVRAEVRHRHHRDHGPDRDRRAGVLQSAASPAQRKIGSVGRASGCEARVVDASGATLPDGETGEIVLRGPQVMTGYYKDDEATARVLHAGRLAAHRRPRLPRRRRLLLRHRPHQGADHQGRREHRAARDRRGAARATRRCSMPPRSAYPTGTTARRSWPASCCAPGAPAREDELRDVLRRSELGRYKTPQRHPLRRPTCRAGPSGKVQRLKLLEVCCRADTGPLGGEHGPFPSAASANPLAQRRARARCSAAAIEARERSTGLARSGSCAASDRDGASGAAGGPGAARREPSTCA